MIRMNGDIGIWIKILKGAKCGLLPYLYNLCREVFKRLKFGRNKDRGRISINNLRFADDAAIMVLLEKEQQR